jgi:hypothetical protein
MKIDAVEQEARRGNLRGLRVAEGDLLRSIQNLVPERRNQLADILRGEFGYVLEVDQSSIRREIEAAIGRGTVRSEKERKRLEEYSDILGVQAGDQDLLRRLELLLASED